MSRPLAPLLLAVLATVGPAQERNAAPRPEMRDHQAAFVQAFNAGTREALTEFVRTRSAARSAAAVEQDVAYWMSVRLEVGPLELVGTTRAQRRDGPRDIYWYRGTTTGAYPGVDLLLDEGVPPRIRGYGVNRAVRPTVAPAPAPVAEADLPAALDRYFRAATDSGHFAGAVAIVLHGRTIFSGAYGPADLAAGRPNTLDTPFRLASVSKIFTGVAIMQLVEQGRLVLDESIARHIPEYPPEIARQVTVRHLLTHTSGIELDGDSVYFARVSGARSLGELLALQVERLPHAYGQRIAAFRPLGTHDYTNEGIDLLGVIVERVSGIPWDRYLAERVFAPAGMIRSGAHFLRPVEGVPIGYTSRTEAGGRHAGRVPVPTTGGAVGAIRPAGSAYASALDMAAFFAALTDGRLLGRDAARTMMSPQVPVPGPPGNELPCDRAYGYTMVVTTCGDRPVGVGHTGGAFGQSTVVEHFPASGHTVIILSNYDRVTWWAHTRVLEMLGLR